MRGARVGTSSTSVYHHGYTPSPLRNISAAIPIPIPIAIAAAG
jgi:hypothetical protein